MSSSLGFKLSVAGGGTAATASAAAGGLYLSSSGTTTEIGETETLENIQSTTEENQENILKDTKPKTKQINPKKNGSKKPTTSVNKKLVGTRYWLFLAATSIDPNVEQSERESYIEWWNQKFNLWKTDADAQKDNKFKNLQHAYHDTEEKSLNKACEAIYKEEDPFDIDQSKSTSRTASNLENNYWRYCSDLNERPKSIVDVDEEANDNGHIGHWSAYGHLFASTKAGTNVEFWKIKQSWFESINDNELDEKFKTYSSSLGEGIKENGKISLIKFCPNVKSLNRVDQTLTKELAVKYCGFSEFYL